MKLLFLFFLVFSVACKEKPVQETTLRLQLVEAELLLLEEKQLEFNAQDLSAKDKKFLQQMQKCAELIEIIFLKQIHPKNIEFQKQVLKTSRAEQKIFQRNHGPWCLSTKNPECNALVSKPERKIARHLWPQGFTLEAYQLLPKQAKARELLSPFTKVQWNARKELSAIPYAKWNLLQAELGELAKELKSAAKYADTQSLKRFLLSRAQAFESDKLYPYDQSDLDWINLDSKWELTIGPYETYRDSFGRKAFFGMYLGKINNQYVQKLKKLRDLLPKFDQKYAKQFGQSKYQAKEKHKTRILKVVDAIFVSGDAHKTSGATVAYHLPNRGLALKKEMSKKVLLLNHLKLSNQHLHDQYSTLFKNSTYNTLEISLVNTALHEYAHAIGPKISKKAFQIEHHTLDELKAETLALYFLSLLHQQNEINKEQLESHYQSAVLEYLQQLQFAVRGAHGKMNAILLGKLFEDKALWINHDGKIGIDQNQFKKTIANLLSQLTSIIIEKRTSDFYTLLSKYLYLSFEGEYKLQDQLQAQVDQTFSRGEQNSSNGFTIVYKSKGLGD